MQSPDMINEMIGRLRINESKITSLRERMLVTDTNMINEYKIVSEEIRSINTEIMEMKNAVNALKETINDIIKGTDNFASSQDLKFLEKYINMWNPLNFVTENEVKQIIKESKQNG